MIRRGRVVQWTNMATKARGREGQWRRITADRREVLAGLWYTYSDGCWFTANELTVDLGLSLNSDGQWDSADELLHIQSPNSLQKCVDCKAENHQYEPEWTINSWPNVWNMKSLLFNLFIRRLWHFTPFSHLRKICKKYNDTVWVEQTNNKGPRMEPWGALHL